MFACMSCDHSPCICGYEARQAAEAANSRSESLRDQLVQEGKVRDLLVRALRGLMTDGEEHRECPHGVRWDQPCEEEDCTLYPLRNALAAAEALAARSGR